jgi:hypothetical protein
MFKNFDQCHFKAVMEDVSAYCSVPVNETNEVIEDKEWSKYDIDNESDSSEEEVEQKSNCSISKITGHV